MDADRLYSGQDKAEIRPENIDCRIFKMNNMQGRTAQEMNKAFEMYYAACQTAWHITDLAGTRGNSSSYKILQKFQWDILHDLQAAADKGWFAVNVDAHSFREVFEPTTSLHGIFRHLARYNGHWKDESWDAWKPGAFTSNVKVPGGINAFYDAIEERGTEVVNGYHDWQKSRANLERAKFEHNWQSLGTKLSWTGTVLEKVGPKMWALAKAPEELMAKVEKRFSLVAKCFDLAEKVHGYMEKYNYITNSGSKHEEAMKLTAEVVAMIVNKVPVFGDAYAGVIRGVPGLINWAQRVAKEHYGEYAMPSRL